MVFRLEHPVRLQTTTSTTEIPDKKTRSGLIKTNSERGTN